MLGLACLFGFAVIGCSGSALAITDTAPCTLDASELDWPPMAIEYQEGVLSSVGGAHDTPPFTFRSGNVRELRWDAFDSWIDTLVSVSPAEGGSLLASTNGAYRQQRDGVYSAFTPGFTIHQYATANRYCRPNPYFSTAAWEFASANASTSELLTAPGLTVCSDGTCATDVSAIALLVDDAGTYLFSNDRWHILLAAPSGYTILRLSTCESAVPPGGVRLIQSLLKQRPPGDLSPWVVVNTSPNRFQ